jgi:hypothetical protein
MRATAGQGEKEDDDHASGRDHTELGYAAVVGREEGQEADRRGEGTEDERTSHGPHGVLECRAHRGSAAQLVHQDHADVDQEVDAEPDEEHREGDGGRIEPLDRVGRVARGPHEAHEQRPGRHRHDRERTERDEQDDHDQREGERSGNPGIASQSQELLVIQGRVARDPHAHAAFRPGARFQRLLADRLEGAARSQDPLELEHRIGHDHPAQCRIQRRALEQHRLPRDAERKLRVHRDGRAPEVVEHRLPALDVPRLVVHVLESQPDHPGELYEARIARERSDHGLEPRHLVGEGVEIVEVRVEQPVALEEGLFAGKVDRREQIRPGSQAP